MYAACEKGYLEAVELLLRSGADPSYQSERALLVACSLGEDKIVSLLLDYGADVNAFLGGQTTALISAIERSRKDSKSMVQLLLGRGADVNIRVPDARPHSVSALSAARWTGNVDIARVLLENGADGNAESGDVRAFLYHQKRLLDLMGRA